MISKNYNYSFYYKSDLYDEEVRYRWKKEYDHEANHHKTYKPKLSHLEIISEVPKELRAEIRKEIYEDIMQAEH